MDRAIGPPTSDSHGPILAGSAGEQMAPGDGLAPGGAGVYTWRMYGALSLLVVPAAAGAATRCVHPMGVGGVGCGPEAQVPMERP